MGTRGTPDSKSTSKSEAELPGGNLPILWQRPGIKKIGCQFLIPNPKTCTNFNHMVSSTKRRKIAGKYWTILGVCAYSFHAPPYEEGLPILLECWPSKGDV